MKPTDRFNVILALAIFSTVFSFSFGFFPMPVTSSLPISSVFCVTNHANPNLLAKAAYAYDINGKAVLYEKNERAQLPLASLTKLMTALTSLDTLSTHDSILITNEALSPEGDSGLFANETWNVQDLIDFSLMSSSNDGAHALALAASKIDGDEQASVGSFVNRMNQKAVSIGMKETFFLNDTGLDTSTTSPGALGSAHDMALLLAYIYATEPDVFQGSAWVSASFISDTRTHKVENTNKISAVIPQVIASKTGFTDLAGGNLAVLYEPTPGRPIAAVILGSTREEREADLLALTESATQELRQSIICSHNGQ